MAFCLKKSVTMLLGMVVLTVSFCDVAPATEAASEPGVPSPVWRSGDPVTYKLLSGSTITPFVGAQQSGPEEPLEGEYTWDKSKVVGSCRLHFKSKSFVIDSTSNHFIEINPRFFSWEVHTPSSPPLNMMSMEVGHFEGAADCPSRMTYRCVTLCPSGGGVFVARMRIDAIRVVPAVEKSEAAPATMESVLSSSDKKIRSLSESAPYLYQSCRIDGLATAMSRVGAPFDDFQGATFSVPKDETWNVTSVGGYMEGSSPGIFAAIIALESPDSVPGKNFLDFMPSSPEVMAYGIINPGPNALQNFPLAAHLPPGSYALIFGNKIFRSPATAAAGLQMFFPIGSSVSGKRLQVSSSYPTWRMYSYPSSLVPDIFVTISGHATHRTVHPPAITGDSTRNTDQPRGKIYRSKG